MGYKSFYSCNLTSSNNNKGGRNATQEAEYLEQGDKKQEKDKVSNELENKKTAIDNAEYIQGRERRREDLAYLESGNIPKWAEKLAVKNETSSHLEFFKGCELYEPNGKTTYRESKIALPKEFTLEQNINLVHDILKRTEIGDLPYLLAIHDKPAQLSPDDKNKHVHIMFSERKPDGIERPIEQYFKQYRPKNPEKGGAKKVSTFTERGQQNRNNNLKSFRKEVEKTINDHYRQNGFDHYVFSGTKEELKKYAQSIGDKRAEELADLPAQVHLGEKRAANLSNKLTREMLELKAYAQAINDKYEIIEHEKEQGIEHKENNFTLPDHEFELVNLLVEYDKKIQDLVRSIASYSEELKEDIQSSDSFNLEKQIEAKEKFITKDIHKSSVNKFLQDKKLIEEKALYNSAYAQIQKLDKRLDGIEKQILTRLSKDSSNEILLKQLVSRDEVFKHCSPKQKNYIESMQRDLERAKQTIKRIEDQHIKTNQTEFAEVEKKVIARNDGMKKKISELKTELEKIRAIEDPRLQELNDLKERYTKKAESITTLNTKLKDLETVKITDNTLQRYVPIEQYNQLKKAQLDLEMKLSRLKNDSILDESDSKLLFFKNSKKENHIKLIEQTKNEIQAIQKQLMTEAAKAKEILASTVTTQLTSEITKAKDIKLEIDKLQERIQAEPFDPSKELEKQQATKQEIKVEVETKPEIKQEAKPEVAQEEKKNEFDIQPQKSQFTSEEVAKTLHHEIKKLEFSLSSTEKEISELNSQMNEFKKKAKEIYAEQGNTDFSTPQARIEIDKITKELLKDNPLLKRLNSLTEAKRNNVNEISELKKLETEVNKQVKFEKQISTRSRKKPPIYKIKSSSPTSSPSQAKVEAAKTIANALLGEPKAAALVAKIEDGKEYDFEGMTAEQRETAIAQIKAEQSL